MSGTAVVVATHAGGAPQATFLPTDVSTDNVLRAMRNWFEPHPVASSTRIEAAAPTQQPPPTSRFVTTTPRDDGSFAVVEAALSGMDFALPSGSVLCPNWMPLQSLTSLDIHDAPQFVLPALAISRFAQLTTLRLAGNGIEYALALSDLPPLLEALDVSDNRFSGALALSLLPRRLVEVNLARNLFVPIPSSSHPPTVDLDGLPATAVYVNLHGAMPRDVLFALSGAKGKPPALQRLFVGPAAHEAPASWSAADMSALRCTDLAGGAHAKEAEPVSARSNLCVCLAHAQHVIGCEDGRLVMSLRLSPSDPMVSGDGLPAVDVAMVPPPRDPSEHTLFNFTADPHSTDGYVANAVRAGIRYAMFRESASGSGMRLMASSDWDGSVRALMPIADVEGTLSSDGVLFSLFGKGRGNKMEIWSTATISSEPQLHKTLPLSDVVAADVRRMALGDVEPPVGGVRPYLVAAVVSQTPGGAANLAIGFAHTSSSGSDGSVFVPLAPIALGSSVYGASVTIAGNSDTIMVRYATDAAMPAFLTSLQIIAVSVNQANVDASTATSVITISEQVRHAALSSDGSTLATASSLVTGLRTSRAETGFSPISGRARKDTPGFVACSADGALVLSAPGDLDGAPRQLKLFKVGTPDLVLLRIIQHDISATKTLPMYARFGGARLNRIFSWGGGEPGRMAVARWNQDDGSLIDVSTFGAKAILDVDAHGRVLSLFDNGGNKDGGVCVSRSFTGASAVASTWSFTWGQGVRDSSGAATGPRLLSGYIAMGKTRDFLQIASSPQPTLWTLYDANHAPLAPPDVVDPQLPPKREEVEVAIM